MHDSMPKYVHFPPNVSSTVILRGVDNKVRGSLGRSCPFSRNRSNSSPNAALLSLFFQAQVASLSLKSQYPCVFSSSVSIVSASSEDRNSRSVSKLLSMLDDLSATADNCSNPLLSLLSSLCPNGPAFPL